MTLHDDFHGRRLDAGDREIRLEAQAEGLTPRGWIFGLLCCAGLSLVIPYWDHILLQTRSSLNLLAPTTVTFMVFFIVVCNMVLGRHAKGLRLTRQDLTLIFCMTILVNPLPAIGFMTYMLSAQMAPYYYATPENKWSEIVLPHLPPELAAQDPKDPFSSDPRPIEWFFNGLPQIKDSFLENFNAIPWDLLARPYALWCLALLFLLGIFFALSALLHPVWSERERLPFPVIQVAEQMMDGFFPHSQSATYATSFFRDRMALWGIGIVFALHSWNFYANYDSNWPMIPMSITHIDGTYLTEAPWRYLQPFMFKIYPSVIGFMYLVSLEVSFSMWFFFAVVLKLLSVIACGWFGLANTGWAFMWARNGAQGLFHNQGLGALFAMVLSGFFMARSHLWQTILEALGLRHEERKAFSFCSRTLWLLLLVSFFGAVGWLVYFRVAWYWAVLCVVLLTMISTGVARLVAEGGVMYIKCVSYPADIIQTVFSPARLGANNLMLTSSWGKVFEFDFYRMTPMINLMGALHAGSQSRMKQRSLLFGLAAALVVTFAVTFFSIHYIAYTHPGGAKDMGWGFGPWPRGFYGEQATTANQLAHWEKTKARYAELGLEVPASEVPSVARTDWSRIGWMAVGAGVMWLCLFLRTRIFWWPHPIGIVLWAGFQGIFAMWFSYFLGWLFKSVLVRFGGQKQYFKWRRFFIGLIVGEALAVILWTLIAWYMGKTGTVYNLEYN